MFLDFGQATMDVSHGGGVATFGFSGELTLRVMCSALASFWCLGTARGLGGVRAWVIRLNDHAPDTGLCSAGLTETERYSVFRRSLGVGASLPGAMVVGANCVSSAHKFSRALAESGAVMGVFTDEASATEWVHARSIAMQAQESWRARSLEAQARTLVAELQDRGRHQAPLQCPQQAG